MKQQFWEITIFVVKGLTKGETQIYEKELRETIDVVMHQIASPLMGS